MHIDMHTHIIPREWPDLASRHGPGPWPRLVTAGTDAVMMLGDRQFMQLDPRFWSISARVGDMDRLKIDVQVLSPIPAMNCYWADAKANQAFARLLNEHVAQVVSENSRRFWGMASVPLQDTHLAISELRHAREHLDLRSVQIGTCPGGRDLDDPELFPFFEACRDLRVSIFVHPLDPVVGRERLARFYLNNILGNVFETAIAMARLICAGVLDRLPGLRVCFAHAGGAFPYVLGRLEKGFHARPETREMITRPPSEYARMIYVDSLSLDRLSLRFAVDRHGHSRVLLGSDYPFWLSESDPIGFVSAAGFSDDIVGQITNTNVCEFMYR